MQHWQDFVLTAGSLVLTLALIPSLRSKNKPAVTTSLVTFLVLAAFGITYITLSLWLAAISISINSLGWLTLAIQKHRQGLNRSS